MSFGVRPGLFHAGNCPPVTDRRDSNIDPRSNACSEPGSSEIRTRSRVTFVRHGLQTNFIARAMALATNLR